MKSQLLDIADRIANQILREEFEVVDASGSEQERQQSLAKTIKKKDLKADPKDKSEELSDKYEDDEDEEAEKDSPIEPKAKPEVKDEEEEEGDDESFSVDAPDTIPDQIQFAQIEKQVNNMRAGKSLKDKAVADELEAYFDALGKGETQALFSYLSAIGAILTGGTPGDEVPRPNQLGINIEPEKKDEPSTVDDEVGTIRTSSSAAPIVVGEIADKSEELALVFENFDKTDRHRCMNGKIVDFGSSACIKDITKRIEDLTHTRDGLSRGTSDRGSFNGHLKFMRQKLRAAKKIQDQKVQARIDQSDSA